MKKDVIICLGTINAPTFAKSKKIAKRIVTTNSYVKSLEIIENYSPQCAWLNEMIIRSQKNTWCLQLDEDMYLYDDAVNTLLSHARNAEKNGIGVGLVHGMLWDIFLEQPIGSLKLWRTKILRKFKFEDVLGSDRKVVRAVKKAGYQVIGTTDILGEHDSAPTLEIAKKKYYEYIHKMKKFNDIKKAENFIKFLKEKNKHPDIIAEAERALKEDIINKSKTII